MAADVLAQRRSSDAGGVEQARRVEPAGRLEHRLGLAQPDRQRDQRSTRVDDRAGRDRVAADLDLVERRLAADPARRRGDEVPLRDAATRRTARPRWTVTSSSGWACVAGSPRVIPAITVGVVDQPLGPQEADGQLVLVPGRAHRDRDVDRVLARSAGPDRERLLARQPVLAHLDASAANGDHPGERGLRGVGSGRDRPSSRRNLRHGGTRPAVAVRGRVTFDQLRASPGRPRCSFSRTWPDALRVPLLADDRRARAASTRP